MTGVGNAQPHDPPVSAGTARGDAESGGSGRLRRFTWEDPAILADAAMSGLTGMAFLRAVLVRELPPAPIAQLLGMELTEVSEGRVVFSLEPTEWMYNPIGRVHGGIAATLLDSCMGCAVQTMLPAGTGYTTSDLQVRYLRAMTATTGRVLAEGTVVHSGRRQATAQGRLYVKDSGKLLATATTGCIVLSFT
jgi:uncharacterized protein (TIGR00369 family)